ncbi:hypothetical protein F751_0935 [Auxenochlorella protothecoides]|uniref:MYND-type domain-containing protein n=1 Tax=Auxenochlorella protothecoides TaxID=3075 RepID=A0A087SDB7_AUXPR|nr:hypothetical protein F751_0935 [Auxenochlorella protothecoides]KFM23721.1 hypothetical protein F751_0935 [Auxenochlorella protothecoides]
MCLTLLEYVRGNCLLPKCRFPHPPFKIPEGLPKPADPIANPPAAAAKQKAAAQAAAAAAAAEGSGTKELAIVTWLGHWHCSCGRVHKLWDSCRGASAAPKAAPGETPKAALGEAPSGGPVPAAKRTASVSYASLLRPEAADPEPAALSPLPDAAPAATLPGNGAAGAAGRQASSGGAGAAAADTLTLEESQRRADLFNAAVDHYIQTSMDGRPQLEIEAAAKIGLDGGPLYYRCASCSTAVSEARRQIIWCPGCKATPFCSGDCHRRLYPSHRGVCGFWPRPLLPSQVALRMGLEAHMVRGLSGGALQGAVLRQMQAVQRSYQAAAVAAAAATGVVGE